MNPLFVVGKKLLGRKLRRCHVGGGDPDGMNVRVEFCHVEFRDALNSRVAMRGGLMS